MRWHVFVYRFMQFTVIQTRMRIDETHGVLFSFTWLPPPPLQVIWITCLLAEWVQIFALSLPRTRKARERDTKVRRRGLSEGGRCPVRQGSGDSWTSAPFTIDRHDVYNVDNLKLRVRWSIETECKGKKCWLKFPKKQVLRFCWPQQVVVVLLWWPLSLFLAFSLWLFHVYNVTVMCRSMLLWEMKTNLRGKVSVSIHRKCLHTQ